LNVIPNQKAGKNDYEAADKGGTAGHKEINRTNLSLSDIEAGLRQSVVQDQIEMIRLRNTSPAFLGELRVEASDSNHLDLSWQNENCHAILWADLQSCHFTIEHKCGDESLIMSY
ncbi:MAG: glycosidase, partial [Candidatus Thiodiazotropha sp. (ex Notomyrtea botanica)]|nr:glycosidase [Candidatus Thiodiazotropha sp. (ex Notomyrtea botanica)]